MLPETEGIQSKTAVPVLAQDPPQKTGGQGRGQVEDPRWHGILCLDSPGCEIRHG